ncbi:hypothetical protein I41_33790 [Lacipirellula limnantheis]|uniref:Cytochrome c domain-containing protein n=2 Tax=Lacipirellula limnantheis TaxID=2528024 RepID=A0A517U0N4_9BACT|nr:hypothetical protein I41_33790 [Lacipirellula limnantheis]
MGWLITAHRARSCRKHLLAALLLGMAIACHAPALADTSEPLATGADVNRSEAEPRHAAMSRRVDELLAQGQAAAGVTPSSLADDAEFLRRASLDLKGVVPRTSEVREFLADQHPTKRADLIDRLLASSGHPTHMATTWRNRILPAGADPSRQREAAALQKWLRTRFARNLRYDNLVGSLLLTNGGDELGPALYYQSHDVAPEKVAASAAELFLGVKLQCAQCHDHPFANWSQREFWGLAAFFARTKSPGNAPGMMQASYKLVDVDRGEVKLPESEEIVPPKYPRGDELSAEDSASRRSQLVLWLTSRDNRYFSRAAVNWAWSHLFGKGLVATLDELDDSAEMTTNEQILDELAEHFVASKFDLQQLWRTLANTQAYQRSSRFAGDQRQPPELFAAMLPKPLTPEQLYDSFMRLAPPSETTNAWNRAGASNMAAMLDEDPNRIEFVRRMRPPPGEPTEYRAGTLQALMLMNGQTTSRVTAPQESRLLGAIDAPYFSDVERVDALFLATLSRLPSAEERALFVDAISAAESEADRRQALSDSFWALLNSTEFAFNH